MPFSNGIPSGDTLRRFFGSPDPEAFRNKFTKRAANLCELPGSSVIAIDGKTSRHGFDKDAEASHAVSAFASEAGIALGNAGAKGEGCEIVGIARLLSVIDCKDSVVAVDRQRKIAEKVIAGGTIISLPLRKH